MPKLKSAADRSVSGNAVLSLRKKNYLNQHDFWTRIGVTQSGGSRYECGRNIPKPVQHLITIAYGDEAEAKALFASLRTPQQ